MKEALKNKKSIMAIITLVIALAFAVVKNGGLDGIIIDVPGSNPIEIDLPEGCECDDECKCDTDEGDCGCGDDCDCPVCIG